MKSFRPLMLLAWVAVLAFAMNCDCDSGGGLHGTEPKVDKYHQGPADVPPDLASYADMPDSGEIEVDFGEVDTDTVASRYLFLRNAGESPLNLVSALPVVGTSTDFFVSCLDGGVFVNSCPYSDTDPLATAGGTDLVVRVSYAPRDVGPDEGAFTLATNSTRPTNDFTVRVRGSGVTPEIEVCVTPCVGDQSGAACSGAAELCNDAAAPNNLALDFGDADMNTALSRRVVIRNRGDRPITLSTLNFSGGDFNQFLLDKNNNALPGTLEVGTEATVFVTYDPGTGGAHRSALQVISNDVNEREIKVDLIGRGMAPRVCPDPLVVDFGNVNTGEAPTKDFLITNCGLMDLTLERLQLSAGSSADFALLTNPANQVLPAGQALTVTVRYSPMERGTDAGGVDIFSNDPASDPASHFTGAVTLKGASVPRACDIQATPFAVNFGGVVLNQPETIVVLVSNQGTDTCTLNSASITRNSAGTEFSILEKPADNTSFQPGDSLTLRLQYLPGDLGVDTGILSLFGNDKDTSEVKVDLNGEGVNQAACDLLVVPTSLRYGTVKRNATAAMSVSLTNNGLETCHITKIELKKGMMTPGDFTVTAVPPLPLVLNRRGQPNSQAEIEVTFAPQSLEYHNAALIITSDDPDLQLNMAHMSCAFFMIQLGQACVPLSGFSAESAIEVVPAELDFGVVTVGCNSPESHVTVYNLGSEALNVTDIYLEVLDGNFEIRSAPALPYRLNGGSDFQVVLRYHPQDTNAHRNTLYIQSDASNVDLLAVPLFGRGTNISEQTDVFHQPNQVKSDVLFVVDNSGSMSEEQQALAQNFGAFIAWATSLAVDFHIGVIATEVQAAETNMGSPPRDIYPGVLVQAPNRPKIITNSTPNVNAAFADNVNIGDCCSDEQEAGLQAAWMALSPPNVDDPTMNGGFVREDAKLYIIIVSDEQDQSRGEPDFYVDFFQNIKGPRNTEMMKISVVVGACPNGSSCSTGSAECGSRYHEVATRTGGLVEDICTPHWDQSLASLGIDAFAAIREFPLSRPADPNTITVTVNGASVPRASSQGGADGWTYYGDTNSIYFGDNYIPERGDRIEVHYTAVCL